MDADIETLKTIAAFGVIAALFIIAWMLHDKRTDG